MHLFSLPCPAALQVSGLPQWLTPPVARSLSAVWEEIPDSSDVDRPGTLALVASRLFAGYEVSVALKTGEPVVRFAPLPAARWAVRLTPPELRGGLSDWFRSDLEGMEGEIHALLTPLPREVLSWADGFLRDRIESVVAERLPGWDFSVQIALEPEEGLVTLNFRPRPPLVLAISPSLYSRTMPAMFQSDLEAKLIPGLSPLIGLPVEWVARHRSDVESMARLFLEDRHSVENMRAEVEVAFVPGPVSRLDARVDSDRFYFQVWVAAYAGLEGHYPEAGIFFGWNTAHLTGVNLELYGEAIVDLDDFGLVHRLGARMLLLHDFWAGAEMEWPGEHGFYRLQWGPSRVRRPYLWWRWNPDLGHEAAVGYRVDEHVSIEIYYDGIKEDRLGLRGLWSL